MTDEIPLNKNRSAIAFLGAVFFVTYGLSIQATALGKQVFDLTRRDVDLGLLGLVEFLPAVLLVTVAGTVADRVDRRKLVVAGMLAEGACSAVLWKLAHIGVTRIGAILATVFAFGIARAFIAPALRAMPANVVSARQLPRVIALNSTMWQAALIAGPVTAGYLYPVSPAAPYVVTGGSCTLAALCIAQVMLRPTDQPGPTPGIDRGGFHAAFEGLRVIKGNPLLMGALSLDLFAVLFGGALALLPAIADRQLGVGAEGLGWLRAAGGIGAATVTIVLAVRPLRRRIGPLLFASVAVFGASTIVLGNTHRFVVAFIAMIVLSGADAISVFIRATLGPLITPDNVRGRVLAVENVFIGASNELGAFESGVVGQLVGTSAAVTFGGFATVAVVLLWSVMFPGLRKIQTFPSHHRERHVEPDRTQ